MTKTTKEMVSEAVEELHQNTGMHSFDRPSVEKILTNLITQILEQKAVEVERQIPTYSQREYSPLVQKGYGEAEAYKHAANIIRSKN